jgi:short-subunit dehydrogenase
LSEAGYAVVLVARRKDRLQKLAGELGSTLVVATDLTADGSIAALSSELQSKGIALDCLVNSAGMGHTGPFAEQDPATLDRMMDLNVRSLVALTRSVLPGMVARGRGAIVNVASTAAFQPVPFLTVYAATKAFVLSFTEGLAVELAGTGVQVQALCPGVTATEFLTVSETHDDLLISKLPQLTAEQVAATSVRALGRSRVRVVPGLSNRAVGLLVRLAPGRLARRVAGELYRPRGARAGGHPHK